MTKAELIKRLEGFSDETEVSILDGFNGGGQPRQINLGPLLFDPNDKSHTFVGDERQDYSDLNTPKGGKIIVMGFGCY